MKKYDMILFDLDGTLTDPEHGLCESYYYGLTKSGVKIRDKKALKKYIGPTLVDIWQEDFGFTRDEAVCAIEKFREYFSVYGWWDNRVYDGVHDMLATLKSRGKILALATSKPEVFARRIVAKFDLLRYFDYVGAASLDGSRDKKWQVIEHVLECAGDPDRSHCILVGDRCFDAEGAARCGIDSLGVLYGMGTRDELEKAGFTYIVPTVDDVVKMLK